MTDSIQTEKSNTKPNLVILGDHDNIATELIKQLSSTVSLNHTPKFTSDASLTQTLAHCEYIVFIDSHHKTRVFLEKSLDLVATSNAKFIYVSQVPKQDSKLFSTCQHNHRILSNHLSTQDSNIRVSHLNNLFGPGVVSSNHNNLTPLFFPLSSKQYIIQGNDQDIIAPLSLPNAAKLIIRALFSSGSKGKIYELAGLPQKLINTCFQIREIVAPLQYSQLESQQQVYKLNPELKHQIDLTNKDLWINPSPASLDYLTQTINWFAQSWGSGRGVFNEPELKASKHLSSNINPSTTTRSLQDLELDQPPKLFTLEKSKKQSQPPTGADHTKPTQSKKTTHQPTRFKLKLKILLLLILILPTWFFVSTTYHFIFLSRGVLAINNQLNSQTYTIPTNQARAILLHSRSLESNFKLISPLLTPLNFSTLNDFYTLLSISQTASESIIDLDQASTSLDLLIELILGKQTGNTPETISNTNTLLLRSFHNLSLLEAQLESLSKSDSILASKLEPTTTHFSQIIKTLKPHLYTSTRFLSKAPNILGFDRKKNYIILLQNSAELRPTGGFVGSFAVTTFENGKLLDMRVQDVYAADGQLKGHVEPPTAIKKYLGEANWYLRDVNWDPDFPTTATRTAWFLDKEINQPVDGVIGINLHVVKNMLEVTGPIHLSDYNETIDSNNLFERVEYQVEIGQFPGSTQKQDIIGSLANQLFIQIQQLNSQQKLQLGKTLLDQLANKQITVYLNDPATQSIISEIDWSGEIINPDCPSTTKSESCVVDYLSIIEANVGVNKANYFISRNIDHQTTISSAGTISHTITISHTNSSPTDNWPGGSYRNYIRFYTPLGSQLNQVNINNQPLSTQQLETSTQHGKSVTGFLVVVPPDTTTTTKISYQIPQKLSNTSPTAYSLYLQKQSGIDTDQIKYHLSLPNNLSIIDSKPKLTTTDNKIDATINLQSDQTLLFEFAR